MELLNHIEPWHWFVLAAALFALEVTATTGFFIGIAVSALILWVLMLLSPELGWELQLAVFGGLSVVLTIAYKKYFKRFNEETDSPLLNDRAAQMVGDSLVLDEDLSGHGAIMIHDTRWQVECEGTIAAGTRVKIADSRGMTLVLRPE
ncbi:MAG: NfeD family protein [Halioglobus sp.]|nr:NfeD family protein [Halioglobus sp.]